MKTHNPQKKNNQGNFFKIKKFLSMRDMVKRKKRQATSREKIAANLKKKVCRIYFKIPQNLIRNHIKRAKQLTQFHQARYTDGKINT